MRSLDKRQYKKIRFNLSTNKYPFVTIDAITGERTSTHKATVRQFWSHAKSQN